MFSYSGEFQVVYCLVQLQAYENFCFRYQAATVVKYLVDCRCAGCVVGRERLPMY